MRPVLFFLLLWLVSVLPVHAQVVSSLHDSTSVVFSQQLDEIYPDAAYSAYEGKPMELVNMWLGVLEHFDKSATDQGLLQAAGKQACFLKLYFTPEGKVKQLFFRLEPPFVVPEKDMKRVFELAVKRLSSIPHNKAYRQTGQWTLVPKKSS